ncbi:MULTISPECIES: hypothetical protein [Enterococcus]|uniref:Uncharacterized protein n=2 Tax=Enterococcus TaxID=1350 RepID=A0AAQ3Y843_9ENTE|nr:MULTISPECIES: hypothetical protein [Enterococcus]EOL50691.1 hypothetical protein UC7_00142 [Enterococcus caccae ATCC BAA-1240]EOT59416.1 hypothetical protein I580_02448 [Enterococcus caccae ATCC BAA-1240]OJG27676.1 hypothetical protein RU98_GL002379 [Enterococcus caccae]OTN82914.1 hypothetical protein A5821_002837 [Enterococcus sp. 7F3_DIV0205]
MSKVKELARNFLQVAPFILSNTIIFIPYFLFLSLSDGTTMERILPFVLFYTFRMTGIFLLKSFKLALTSFNVLIISILLGGAGCLIGVLGQFYFPAYLFSAVLLGISASWLPAANTTVNYHEKRQGYSALTGRKYLFILLIFGGVIASLMLTKELRIPLVLGEYTLLYIAAYHTVTHYPDYEIDFNEVNQQVISVKEFFLFLFFFVLLLFIRSARLLFDPQLLDVGIIGFSILFLIAGWYLNSQRKIWKLPLWLNLLTFANGMCMNFLLLFGTFYVSLRLGIDRLTATLYVPYILGIIGSAFVIKFLYRLFPKVDPKIVHLSGFILSLFLLLFRPIFPVGIFLLSCFISATGNFLNQQYYQEEILPQDQRIITKYSTQTKGSVTHQLLLMSVLWLLAKQAQLPVKTVLQITAHRTHNPAALQLVEHVHVISIVGLMLFFTFILYEVVKHEQNESN